MAVFFNLHVDFIVVVITADSAITCFKIPIYYFIKFCLHNPAAKEHDTPTLFFPLAETH